MYVYQEFFKTTQEYKIVKITVTYLTTWHFFHLILHLAYKILSQWMFLSKLKEQQCICAMFTSTPTISVTYYNCIVGVFPKNYILKGYQSKIYLAFLLYGLCSCSQPTTDGKYLRKKIIGSVFSMCEISSSLFLETHRKTITIIHSVYILLNTIG